MLLYFKFLILAHSFLVAAKILNFLDYEEGFEKNLCAIHEFLLNRHQNVQENE